MVPFVIIVETDYQSCITNKLSQLRGLRCGSQGYGRNVNVVRGPSIRSVLNDLD